MLSKLAKLADHLDKSGFLSEADYVDELMHKISAETPQLSLFSESPPTSQPNAEAYEIANALIKGSKVVSVKDKDSLVSNLVGVISSFPGLAKSILEVLNKALEEDIVSEFATEEEEVPSQVPSDPEYATAGESVGVGRTPFPSNIRKQEYIPLYEKDGSTPYIAIEEGDRTQSGSRYHLKIPQKPEYIPGETIVSGGDIGEDSKLRFKIQYLNPDIPEIGLKGVLI